MDKQDDNPLERVSKIEVAERQLKTAIKLFFEQGDAVSIHALTSNAQSILTDIGKGKGIQSLKSNDGIRPEKYTDFINIIHAPQNFIKHSDKKDPDEVFDFRPAVTKYQIFDALHIYSKLKGEIFQEGLVFLMWFHLKHPGYMEDEVGKSFLEQNLAGINPNNLSLFEEVIKSLPS